jgi:hypothetical protein
MFSLEVSRSFILQKLEQHIKWVRQVCKNNKEKRKNEDKI